MDLSDERGVCVFFANSRLRRRFRLPVYSRGFFFISIFIFFMYKRGFILFSLGEWGVFLLWFDFFLVRSFFFFYRWV